MLYQYIETSLYGAGAGLSRGRGRGFIETQENPNPNWLTDDQDGLDCRTRGTRYSLFSINTTNKEKMSPTSQLDLANDERKITSD